MKAVRFHPEALRELLESAKFYENEQAGLGKRFLEAVRACTEKIRLFPAMYPCVEGEARRCRVAHFPFGVVFREKNDQIHIVAVIHCKRDPDYWQKRI